MAVQTGIEHVGTKSQETFDHIEDPHEAVRRAQAVAREAMEKAREFQRRAREQQRELRQQMKAERRERMKEVRKERREHKKKSKRGFTLCAEWICACRRIRT